MALLDAVSTPDQQAIDEHRAVVIPDDREAVDDAGSLSDHEAQFATPKRGAPVDVDSEPVKPRTEDGRFQPRHRAKSQQATPDDVAQIRTLTRELREKEEALSKVKPSAEAASPRVLALRRQIRALEMDIADAQPKPAPVAAPAAVAPRQVVAPPSQPVPEKFTYQTYDDAVAKDPSLSFDDYQDQRYLALSRWNQQREVQTQAKEQTAQQAQQAEQALVAHYQAVRSTYEQRARDYIQAHPEHRASFENVPDTAGAPLLNAAVMQLDNGPEMLHRLRQDSDSAFDEAILFAYGKPVDEANVARMQRWLQKRVPAGITGAAATPVPIKPLPSPPTPVRTGSTVPGAAAPLDDGAPLSAHEARFHKRRR
jgi:hypothetical protein